MKTIRISEEVWAEMAKIGKFGETPDIVLRRVFKLDQQEMNARSTTKTTIPPFRATRKMEANVSGGSLYVRFAGGKENSWRLPDPGDKQAIREVRDDAVQFAEENGASVGQKNAVMKALTSNGYWISKN